jgi:hypothetical protein
MPALFDRLGPLIPLLLWAITAWQFQHAGVHIDTARDWAQALNIAQGIAWPTVGPDIAHAVHLGPIWFYILALPFAVGGDAQWVAAWVGLLLGSQYWWAYRLGTRWLGSPLHGALTAVALTLPNWNAVYMAGVTHTVMGVPTFLAALWAISRWFDAPAPWRAGLAGLACGVALHAHPTTGLLGVVLLSVVVLRPGVASRATHLATASVGLVVLFAPYLMTLLKGGLGDGHRLARYAEAQPLWTNLTQAPAVLWATLAAAAPVQQTMLPANAHVAQVSGAVWSLALVLALIGAFITWRKRLLCPAPWRTLLALSVGTAVCAAAARPFVTFYMIAPLAACVPLLLAIGWAAWTPSARPAQLKAAVTGLLIVSLSGLHLAWAIALRNAAYGPGYSMDLARVLYLGRDPPTQPMPLKPIWPQAALPALADFLCAHPGIAMHGPGAVGVDLMGDVLMRAQCPNAERVVLGGTTARREHWVGLPCAAGLVSGTVTGSVCWTQVKSVIASTEIPIANALQHPPRPRAVQAGVRTTAAAALQASDTIVATNLLMEWSSSRDWQVQTLAGAALKLADQARWYRVASADASPNARTDVSVEVTTNAPEAIDIVIVQRP